MSPRLLLLAACLALLPPGAGAASAPLSPAEKRAFIAVLERPATADSAYAALMASLRARGVADSAQGAYVRDLYVGALMRQGRYFDPRLKAIAESVVVLRTRLGSGDLEWVASANTRTLVLSRLQVVPEASASANAALARARALPETSAVRADAFRFAGLLAAQRGDASEALALHREAWAHSVRTRGPGSLEAARDEVHMAFAYVVLGEPRTADSLAAHAVPVLERLAPAHDPFVTYAYGLWGSARSDLGDVVGALRQRERAVRNEESVPGGPRPELPAMLRLLAGASSEVGDTTLALRSLDRAIELNETLFGPDGRETVQARADRARLRADCGRYEPAIAETRDVIARFRRTLGPRHEWVARALRDLGRMHAAIGERDTARAEFDEALSIFAERLGPKHRLAGNVHQDLADLESRSGRPREAFAHLAAAESSLTALAGEVHPRWVDFRFLEAQVLARAGSGAESWRAALRADSLADAWVSIAMAGLTEGEALAVSGSQPPAAALAVAISAAPPAGLPAADRDALRAATWTAVARQRTRVLDELAERHPSPDHDADPRLAALRDRYREASERWARVLIAESGADAGAAARREERRVAWVAAERELALASAEFRRQSGLRRLTWEQVRGDLPAGAALVAYAQARDVSGGVPRLVAFVLAPGARAPDVVPISDVPAADSLVRAWRASVELPDGLARAAEDSAEAACRLTGAALRAALWAPAEARAGAATRVFVVPDGPLQLVSFGALPAAAGGWLAEDARAPHELSAESDLVPAPAEAAHARGLLAMGGADFGVAPAAAAARRGEATPCADLSSLRFGPLPESGREARAVANAWNLAHGPAGSGAALLLTGANATEGAFKRAAPGRAVLHLATHGFFLGERCGSVGTSARRGIGAAVPTRAIRVPPAEGAHPLRVSGLVWAGANRRAESPAGADDGVLTADEVSALDLRGTEWAVLSACETGAGDIRAGVGVLGLRRAFQVAGARTVIMSLWSIEDDATSEWMAALYRGRASGLATADAVRGASREVLAARRARGASTHPFHWGAFVAAGDWR